MSEHISGELLSSYFDEELNEKENAMIERHLSACPYCQDDLNHLTSMKKQIKSDYLLVEIPDSIEDRVMAKIQQSIIESSSSSLNRTAFFVVLTFVIIALCAAGPFFFLGVHVLNTLFSIAKGLIYAIPSLLATIPYMIEVISAVIFILIVLAIFILRYLVNTMVKTVEVGDL